MKKHKILFYSFLMVGIVALDSCFDDAGTKALLNDASKSEVEINEAGTATGAVVERAYSRNNDGILKKDSIRINLNGPQRSTPVNVTFAVDPSSTAVAGFHYNLVTAAGTVTIAPNTSFVYIRYTVNADKINIGEKWTLKFVITAADVKISANYGALTRSMLVICPSNIIEGVYTGTQTDDDIWFGTAAPLPSSNPSVTIARVANSPNTYTITDISAGGYNACCGFNLNQGATFIDVCGAINAVARTNAQFTVAKGKSDGTWDAVTKTLIIHYHDATNGSAGGGYDPKSKFVKQ